MNPYCQEIHAFEILQKSSFMQIRRWQGVLLVSLLVCFAFKLGAQQLLTGADQPSLYLSKLKGKRVGLVVNQTSQLYSLNDTATCRKSAIVNSASEGKPNPEQTTNSDNNQIHPSEGVHIVDFLIKNQISITRIFAPEHGFRGEAGAGEMVANSIDPTTGIPIVSIYGKNRKPTCEQLNGIDLMIFDIQDVGCRFYTYISTLHNVMEACAECGIPLLVLDRPNPNGDYVAGPVLQPAFKSFVGMDPIPVVHGCTVGELALMINGEHWLAKGQKAQLEVIRIAGYTHLTKYEPPVRPSPNLPNYRSIRLYPSLCFFEATQVSIGRGTQFPFQVIGAPDSTFGNFSFTPVPIQGLELYPTCKNQRCYGEDLRQLTEIPDFTLEYFIRWFGKYENKSSFLSRPQWFNLLIGNNTTLQAIEAGKSYSEISKSWIEELDKYMTLRDKYLLYPDFKKRK